MRLLALLAFAITAGAAEPKYPTFVRVPYTAGIEELVFADAKAGKVKMPPYLRAENGILEMLATDTEGKKSWQHRDTLSLLAWMVYGQDKAFYDNDGHYFLATEVYDKYKDRLVQHHQGRLESFMTTAAKKRLDEEAKKTGTLALTTDPKDYETFVWDATDKVWRWPQGLNRVESDYKLPGGRLLKAMTPAAELQTGVIETLLTEWRKKTKRIEE